jgi:membrane-associated phospholipid phosphatase
MSVRSEVTSFARGNPLGRRGVREVALIGALYLFYTVTRTFAEDDLAPAQERALDLRHLEGVLRLDWEHAINDWFVAHAWAAVPASYWYAAAHYVVTLLVLVWLYRRGAAHYDPARWALVVASLIALACYLLLPTAPPRLTGGYVDVLGLHANVGWWGADASAPKGMGQLTNELAAFPSLHAGWALWVALVVRRNTRNLWLIGLAWTHAFITAVVVIGTGNHWILDVLVGWALVILAMWLVDPWFADQQAVTRVRVRFRHQLLPPPAPVVPADDQIPDSCQIAADCSSEAAIEARERRHGSP